VKHTNLSLKAIALCSVLAICGCNTSSIVRGSGPALAQVEIPFKDDVTSVKCTASFNLSCQNGISHLRNRDWQKAVDELNQAISKDGKDVKAQFALGVAYEMLNELDKAMEHYKVANFLKGDPEYMRAVDRVDYKKKHQTVK